MMNENRGSNGDGKSLFGGVEAGGTKIVCVVGRNPDDILTRTTISTKHPDETIPQIVAFFNAAQNKFGNLAAIGVGSFGPLELNPKSPQFGCIKATPKQGWQGLNWIDALQTPLDIPVIVDTDVNGAALGEWKWGAAKGLHHFVYVTVGTGIGGGAVLNNELHHGSLHLELGHMRIPHNLEQDPFAGICPFHGDCLEGLASGPAIASRWKTNPATIPADHRAWKLEARYLAFAMLNIFYVLSPERVVIGGGVMQQNQLYEYIRAELTQRNNAYLPIPGKDMAVEEFIVPPKLGTNSGVFGALALAETVLDA